MEHELSLYLELLAQGAWGLRFRLGVQNRSDVKLLLPPPTITGLHFGNTATMEEAGWSTCVFVSATGGEFTLDPGEERSFVWQVRPAAVPPPEADEDFDYSRWCVELSPGEYLVWFGWRVDRDFFDPDTHMRLPGLEALAAQEGATAWQGEALSNRLRVVWP